MNKHTVQYLLTPKGERLAVLPASEYDALVETVEDLEDIADAERIMARIRSGEEELIPHEIVKRIVLDRENPIRVYREYRGMTGKQLAEAAGLSAAYMNQIENGKRQGTFDVMAKIAKALRVDLDDLVMEQ